MKILHILNHTGHANGHVCALVDLACSQSRAGHRVHVCSAGGDFDPLFAEYGVTHIRIDQSRKPVILAAALVRLRRLIREIRPDIVHAHMMTSAVLVAALRPFMGYKLVTSVHNEFERSAILMGLGQRVIGVSEAVSQSMIRRGISAGKIRTVLNGTLNSPRFPKPGPAARALRHPAVTFVGGLHPRKGVDDLIRAFAIVAAARPDAHLYLIGSGPFREAYETLAQAACPANVSFCGHFDDPRPFLLASDIFVLPSLAEPAGLVLSEAREASCAIVATNVGGIPEMIERGEAGILVPPRRPDRLAAEILKLIEDPSYLSEMRARSQTNLGRLALERVVAETDRIYQELLA